MSTPNGFVVLHRTSGGVLRIAPDAIADCVAYQTGAHITRKWTNDENGYTVTETPEQIDALIAAAQGGDTVCAALREIADQLDSIRERGVR